MFSVFLSFLICRVLGAQLPDKRCIDVLKSVICSAAMPSLRFVNAPVQRITFRACVSVILSRLRELKLCDFSLFRRSP